jgi:CRISPR-associated protein Csd1
MLVQALADYADKYLSDQLSEQEWEEKPVPVLIDIGPRGRFLGPVERIRYETRGKKTITLPQPLLVPKSPVNRNSGLHPLLAADDIKYVLGPGAWTVQNEIANAEERHEAFVRLIRTAAETTQDEALLACVQFYNRPDQVQAARDSLKSAKPGTFIALSAGGPVVARPVVKSFWNDHYRRAFQTRVDAGGVGECLISGRVGPIAPTHEKVKGTSSLGGQKSGVSLMSFDKQAFRSYGWEQNANSPVAPDRAMAYVLALNDLLRADSGKRRDIAGIGYIFWTKQPERFDPIAILDRPTPEQVAALLQLDPKADPDPNMFFMAGLAGNGARLQVRYWVAESLDITKANIKGWFDGLCVLSLNGQPAPPPKLWQLFYALEREGKPTPQRVLALIRRAIEGSVQPLGCDMLAVVLNRLRHPAESKADSEKQDYRFTAARLGLVRLCVNDLQKQGERPMTERLDPGQNDPAYLCGRLLAEFDNLQDAASGDAKVNLTIADRYYTLASTNPRVAFPKIEGLAKSHFRKLRRDNRGAMVAIERRVTELHEKIGCEFPPILSLDGQGRFALGYYHQKAERSRQIAKNMEKKSINQNAENQEQS